MFQFVAFLCKGFPAHGPLSSCLLFLHEGFPVHGPLAFRLFAFPAPRQATDSEEEWRLHAQGKCGDEGGGLLF